MMWKAIGIVSVIIAVLFAICSEMDSAGWYGWDMEDDDDRWGEDGKLKRLDLIDSKIWRMTAE